MKDFFISYNKADHQWAEWIAWQLEAAGYTTIIQVWDFRPGSSFVLDMQRATTEADRTIAVLSEDYLNSLFTQPEWATAFAQDPTSGQMKLLPVRVARCELKGLLTSIVYIDLVGVEEERAKELLIKGINQERAKPISSPSFPRTSNEGKPVNVVPHFPTQSPQAISPNNQPMRDGERNVIISGNVSGSTIVTGNSNTILIQPNSPDTAPSDVSSLARKWLTALNRLQERKQINSEDHQSVLKHVLQCEINSASDCQSVERLLAQCPDLTARTYAELSDEMHISKRLVTKQVARVHQILTAIQLNLDVVFVNQGVRFVLIPPGTTRDGLVNNTYFYLAETVLTECDWARIKKLPDEDSPRPRLNLSLNEVRALLESANQNFASAGRWDIPTSEQWLYTARASEIEVPRQRSQTLKTNPPSSFGIYDLLGVVWQICYKNKTRKMAVVQGGSRFTVFNTANEIPLSEPVTGTVLEGEDWGFRPALLL